MSVLSCCGFWKRETRNRPCIGPVSCGKVAANAARNSGEVPATVTFTIIGEAGRTYENVNNYNAARTMTVLTSVIFGTVDEPAEGPTGPRKTHRRGLCEGPLTFFKRTS